MAYNSVSHFFYKKQMLTFTISYKTKKGLQKIASQVYF